MQLLLSGRGLDVRAYGSSRDLLVDPLSSDADVMVADFKAPGHDGLRLIRSLRERGWLGCSLLIADPLEAGLIPEAENAGYDRVLQKPLVDAALVRAVEVLLDRSASRRRV